MFKKSILAAAAFFTMTGAFGGTVALMQGGAGPQAAAAQVA